MNQIYKKNDRELPPPLTTCFENQIQFQQMKSEQFKMREEKDQQEMIKMN